MADVGRLVAAGMPAAWARLLGGGSPGEFRFFERTAAPQMWLPCNGDTFGAVGSGATYTDAIYVELFAQRWATVSNTYAPILNSNGTPGTRGTSAAADWAALKRLPLPNLRGKPPIGQTASSTGSATGEAGGAVAISISMPAHYHGIGIGTSLQAAGQTLSGSVQSGVEDANHSHTTSGIPTGQITVTHLVGAGGWYGVSGVGTVTSSGISNTHHHAVDIGHTHNPSIVSGNIGFGAGAGGVDGNVAQTLSATAPYYAGLWCVAY